MKASAKLVSCSLNLRTGDVTLIIESTNQSKVLRISAIDAFDDSNLMRQLNIEDRQLVAYWAGIEDAKTQAAQYQLLKQLLKAERPVSKAINQN